MSVTISTQQSDWYSNIYVVTVTRVLLGVGVFYLVRSIVQLVRWSCFPESSRRTDSQQPTVREQATGMDMEDLVLDVLDTLGTAANPADTVELQLPQPSFDLRNILCRTRSLPAPMSEPGSFTVAVEDVEAQTNGGTATALGQGEENTSRSR